jgi:hypothetical protein
LSFYSGGKIRGGQIGVQPKAVPATFKVRGPFRIPTKGKQHPYIESGCDDFWKQPETGGLASERGCYLFAIRAAKGFRLVYVGKTKKSFAKECFTYHKIADHYQPALADTGKGTPVMFLITLGHAKGPINNRAISQLESFLIQNAVAKNPHLSNVQGTKQEEWGITGVIRGGKGKVSAAAKEFRKAMGLRGKK